MPLLKITVSEFVGDLVTPELPAKLANWRGPYKRRRQKRWYRAHKPYYRANGKCLISRDLLVCHPADYEKFRDALERCENARPYPAHPAFRNY